MGREEMSEHRKDMIRQVEGLTISILFFSAAVSFVTEDGRLALKVLTATSTFFPSGSVHMP